MSDNIVERLREALATCRELREFDAGEILRLRGLLASRRAATREVREYRAVWLRYERGRELRSGWGLETGLLVGDGDAAAQGQAARGAP